MRQEFRKGAALIFAVFMIATVFAAIPVVDATVYSETNNWEIYINDDPLTGVDPFPSLLYPGQQDVGFSVNIVNGGGGTDIANLDGCTLSVQTATVRDENGDAVTSPIAHWDSSVDNWGNTIAEGNDHTFVDFQFDLLGNAAPGTYNLTIDLEFTDSDGTPAGPQHFTGYILFEISSNIQANDPVDPLYAGQISTQLDVPVTLQWNPPANRVSNFYLNLSDIPAGITFHPFFNLPGTTYWVPGDVGASPITASYTIDVARDMEPGIYTINYTAQYTNPDDVRCTETGQINVTVEYTPVIEAEVVGSTRIVTSAGGTPMPVVEVRFRNTGTVDLANIDITLDSSVSSTIYEPATPYPVAVNPVHLDYLAMGSVTSGSWYVDLEPYVAAGEDAILFNWDAHYLDNGTTGNTGGDISVEGGWTGSGIPILTYFPSIPGPTINPWIAGAFVPATALVHNTIVEDPTELLYAGETFADQTVTVKAYWADISDVYLNLTTIPANITFDETSARIPGIVDTTGENVVFRVDVERNVAPGIYPVYYQTQYTNTTGERLTDVGVFNLTVAFTPIIEAEAVGETTITQGDASIPVLEVRFNNTGNVDLRNITITPDLDGTFFYSIVDFYEGADASDKQNAQMVDTIQIDSLAQGENTSNSWFVALDPYVQAGQHRILFDWTATYFDDGSTGNNTGYQDVTGGWWDDDSAAPNHDSTPMVPVCDVNPGTEWIAGAYVMVTVNDNHPDFTADKMRVFNNGNFTSSEVVNLRADLVYVKVGTTITNFEKVPFDNLGATLQVGPGTPFLNPLNHSATTVDNSPQSAKEVGANGTADMFWFVDIDPNTVPGIYVMDIVFTGRNADTGQEITAVIQSVVEVKGFGPELLVTSVTTGDINPGEQFTMNLTITNQGDDTARDVFVSIPNCLIGDDYTDYWYIIDGFVDSISTYRDDYQNWNLTNSNMSTGRIRDNSNITLEQLNINDAKDIVDLNLYIEGVYTHPAPVIWMVKASSLAPGESVTVTFQMMTNANMAPGRPYIIPIETRYIASDGTSTTMDNIVTVQSTGSVEPYHATTGSQIITSDNALGWGFLGVIFVLVLLLAWMFGPRRREEEPVSMDDAEVWSPPPVEQQQPFTYPDMDEAGPQENIVRDESIPEIAEMSVDEPAAVDVQSEPVSDSAQDTPPDLPPSEEAPSDEVPLVYDEKDNEPESF